MTSAPDVVGAGRFIGQSVRRREDPRLLAGRGHFVDDVNLPRMLHVAFLRSDLPAARIRRIDGAKAAELPGVAAVFAGADLNPIAGPLGPTVSGPSKTGLQLQPLAANDVRFVGDPIALVVASSRYLAEDACELIEVDLEATRPVISLAAAMADGAPVVHPEIGTNVLEVPRRSDPHLEAIFADAAHVVTRTFSMARTTNVPMEGRGLVVDWDPFARTCRVWPSTQSPHEIKAFASRVLNIPQSRVHVEFGDVGGGFGQKMYPTREEGAVLLAAKLVGTPIKWIEDRRENLVAANQARHDSATVSLAIDASGHFLAATFDLVEGVGSYPLGGGGGGGAMASMVFTGPYRIPALGFSCRTVFTNTCGKGAYRGPWAIETIAREQLVDAAARELGIDPLDLRRRNVIHQDDLPYTLPSGAVYDSVSTSETLELAAAMVGERVARGDEGRAHGAWRRGVGFSLSVEPSAVGRGGWATEQAVVRIDVTGSVEVLMGTGSHGHSLETTIPQIVADHLGCGLEDVALRQGGDTPYGPGTGGSRSAVIAGGAAQSAAILLRDKVVEIAAHMLEAAPADLEVAGSRVTVRGTPAVSVNFADIARLAYLDATALPVGLDPGLEASSRFRPPTPFTWSTACHICVCDVDVETGVIAVRRFIVSEDCGVMINPMVVEGQIAGGVAQGIGGALFEEMAYDVDGNPLASTFLDYLIPTATDLPDIEYGHIETSSASLGGYRGMGEGGAIASPAAVANAVNDALAGLGTSVTEFPITPSRVIEAIASMTW